MRMNYPHSQETSNIFKKFSKISKTCSLSVLINDRQHLLLSKNTSLEPYYWFVILIIYLYVVVAGKSDLPSHHDSSLAESECVLPPQFRYSNWGRTEDQRFSTALRRYYQSSLDFRCCLPR